MAVSVPPRTFQHDAFVHDTDDDYVAALVPMLEGALERGEIAAAVVSSPKASLLGQALGRRADRVELVDAGSWYEHPVSTIAAYEARLNRSPSGVRTFLVGEVQFGDDPGDWTAWTRYESLLNSALAPYDASVVCPYDRRILPAKIVEDALRTHPFVVDGGGRHPSRSYCEPEVMLPTLPPTVDIPGREPDIEVSLSRSLREARRQLSSVTTSAGFDAERSDELTLAVNEIATNALKHGRGPGTVQVWVDGTGLTCVVKDHGAGASPQAGFRAPPLGAASGYGLWLSRRIFDRVDTVVDDDGFRVALFASIARRPRRV